MKKMMICGVLLSASLWVRGNEPGATASSVAVIQRGPHHSIKEHVRVIEKGNKQHSITNRYTVLGTGLNRWNNTEFTAADASIELHPEGAVASKSQHKIKFLANINNWNGAIDLETADGKRFKSRPLGISYFDVSTGNNVLIAELKDSVGTLFPPNKVLYADAFTDVKADLEYNNFLAGLQQNLIIREQLPRPSDFGLDNDATMIQLLTEFFDPPVPAKRTEIEGGVEDDTRLDFGLMKIGVGKSFIIGDEDASVPVRKQWIELEGRDFLIEQIPYSSVKDLLDTLPLSDQAAVNRVNTRVAASTKRKLPEKPLASRLQDNSMQVAKSSLNPVGFVLDYSILAEEPGNVVLQSDATYYVENDVYVGTLTIEGGAVLKFSSGYNTIIVADSVTCLAEPYHPFIMTGKDDNSVGEVISGSTGIPSRAGYASHGLTIHAGGNLRSMRISHLRTGILSSVSATYSDMQFVNCGGAIEGGGSALNLRNVLVDNSDSAFTGVGTSSFHVEHLTAHRCNNLTFDMDIGACSIYLTNSLLAAVTNWGNFTTIVTQSVEVASSDAFQTVGAGSHYLDEPSPYRDAGTTNISADLLLDLARKTTYPPVIISNLASTVTFAPQAPRDYDTPDLGYHYDPLDFAISNAVVENIIITNGAAIAFYGGTGQGLSAETFASQGSPMNLNRLVWYNTVQEQSDTWNSVTPGFILSFNGEADVRCLFTDFSRLSSPPGYGYHFVDGTNGGMGGSFSFQDCRFSSGLFRFQSMTNSQSVTAYLGLTNCLFERVGVAIRAIDNPIYSYGFNNHFHWGSLTISTQAFSGDYGFTFRDNVMYRPLVTQTAIVTNSHNGVWFSTPNRFTPTNANDVVFNFLNQPTFIKGPLGGFYQASNHFINQGSRTADLAGLYHYTTTTNQVQETNTTVDIGLHYVAINSSTGYPFDLDSDGLADYFEDANGNGAVDSGETDFEDADTDNDGISDYLEFLQGGDPLVNGSVADTSGAINLRIFTPLE